METYLFYLYFLSMKKNDSVLGDVPDSHKAIRLAIREFVLKDAMEGHKEWLTTLYDSWEKFNEEFFDGALIVPCVFLAEPKTPRALADCTPVSAFGARSQIRIRPSLLTGKHKCINEAAPMKGRILFIADVLLHEMIHQWQEEILGNDEKSYKGHGALFAGKCNKIGEVLGLAAVRLAKARGKDKDLPSCSYWPHNVRPQSYYLGAYVPPEEKEQATGGDENGENEGEETEENIDSVGDLVLRFQQLSDENRLVFLDQIKAVMKRK